MKNDPPKIRPGRRQGITQVLAVILLYLVLRCLIYWMKISDCVLRYPILS